MDVFCSCTFESTEFGSYGQNQMKPCFEEQLGEFNHMDDNCNSYRNIMFWGYCDCSSFSNWLCLWYIERCQEQEQKRHYLSVHH